MSVTRDPPAAGPTPTSAQLIAEKYREDGERVVHDYQALNFAKHLALMRKHLGLRPGSKVLDVGCGTGALLVELALAGADVAGIDTFEEAGGIDRRIAEARLREHGLRAELLEGTAAHLPFASGTFDIVASIGMLEHIPPGERKVALQEMFRAVKPGGGLFLIAGPTRLTPFDQHIPGHPFSNWMSRSRKLAVSAGSGRRQFLAVPWGISRAELREALPDGRFENLYGEYFALGGGGEPGAFSLHPLRFLVWAKRKFNLHRVFGLGASLLYLVHQEHCHILAIHKRR